MQSLVRRRVKLVSCAVVALSFFMSPLAAETLGDALSGAYHNNSTLEADRARQRADDEAVPQALSGWRPTITAQESIEHRWSNNSAFGGSETNLGNITITLSQPVFNGYKTVEGTAAAEANVRAGRQQLLATEQLTLFNAVQAYLNVIQFRQILALRQKNVGVLQSQLKASQARFTAGELTRTDVAQSRSSLSGAQGQVAIAIANVKAAEANYRTVVGHSPTKLSTPRMAQRPRSLEAAYSIAQQTNPSILAAAQVQDAAEHNINVIAGDLLPSFNLQASANYNRDLNVDTYNTSASIAGTFTVPIYEAGRVYSGVRQAKETASKNRIQVISQVRAVRESVAVAWSSIDSTTKALASARDQAAASRLALDGVRQEYQVGSRSTIDVLNAQQTLVGAEISVVTAQHDQLLQSYQLLASMGHLTAQHLGIRGIYNVKEQYNDVRNKWIGLDPESGEPH